LATKQQKELKIEIGSAVIKNKEEEVEIKGRDMMAGLPKTIVLKTNETVEAITDELGEVIQAVKKVLQDTPPELAADIIDRGIVLCRRRRFIKES